MIINYYHKFKKNLSLSFQLAKTGFKLKNEGSFLGILWYLLNPVLMFGLLLLIFSELTGKEIANYPLYLLLGIIIFNFFAHSTIESSTVINNSAGIIKAINFPRQTLISSAVLQSLFSHLFEIIIFIIFLLIFQTSLIGIIFYPIILLFLYLFTYGISLILSSVSIYLADLKNSWLFVSRLLWFATPIFYTIGEQKELLLINLFNPMYYFITVARDIIIYAKMPALWLIGGMIGYTLLSLLAGSIIFNRLKKKFTELI